MYLARFRIISMRIKHSKIIRLKLERSEIRAQSISLDGEHEEVSKNTLKNYWLDARDIIQSRD